MGFIMPLEMAGFPMHPAHPPRWCAYCHHRYLLQQQLNSLKAMKFRWRPPAYNCLKLNTDGSSKGNPGPSSFGGLIRDSTGRWLCGYMGKMKGKPYTSLEAEVWSIFQGVSVIKMKNLRNMLIETDCESVLMIGVKKKIDKDDPLKGIMDAICTIMIEQNCTLVHTRRDGNRCADQLAKFGGMQSEEYTFLEEPPLFLMPYLSRDMEAAVSQ